MTSPWGRVSIGDNDDGQDCIAVILAHPKPGPRAIEARLVADPDPFNPHGFVRVWTPEP